MRKLSSSIAVKIAIILFSVFCIFNIIRTQFKINDSNSQIDDKREQLEQAEQNVEELERELDEVFGKDYVVRIAKEKLGLRLPQEIIFYNGD